MEENELKIANNAELLNQYVINVNNTQPFQLLIKKITLELVT